MLQTSAKVNLVLEVLGKRPDGYHEIATVMQTVDLFDRLTLEAAPTISLETDDSALPADERNLIVRAALLLRQVSGVEAGARMRLRKRIPVAAGLGGGSSDAAATLWGLNRLWGLRWPRARLSELAGRLGMDVPFFLTGGPALATGRGERVERLPAAGGYALVLVNPRVPLSTVEVYERVPAGWRAEPARRRPHEGGAPGGRRAGRRDVRQRTHGGRDGALARPCPPDPATSQPGGLGLLGGADPLGPGDPRGVNRDGMTMGRRLAVGLGALDPATEVRSLPPQPTAGEPGQE